MSQEAVPEPTRAAAVGAAARPEQKGAPKGLLQQMEELMAALSADLTQLDADLQSTRTARRRPATRTQRSAGARARASASSASTTRT